jgi:hypothetical protein
METSLVQTATQDNTNEELAIDLSSSPANVTVATEQRQSNENRLMQASEQEREENIVNEAGAQSNSQTTEAAIAEEDVAPSIDSQNDATHSLTAVQQTAENFMLLPIGQKKHWRAPDAMNSFKKILISDENFVTPVTSDFFHLILENGSIWNLYNVATNSQVNKEAVLILIHIGYKYVVLQNLRYITTIINKLKEKAPNAKILFTNLIQLPRYKHIDEFNKFCNEKYAANFLRSDIENADFSCKQSYSSKLFQNWNNQITRLN